MIDTKKYATDIRKICYRYQKNRFKNKVNMLQILVKYADGIRKICCRYKKNMLRIIRKISYTDIKKTGCRYKKNMLHSKKNVLQI